MHRLMPMRRPGVCSYNHADRPRLGNIASTQANVKPHSGQRPCVGQESVHVATAPDWS